MKPQLILAASALVLATAVCAAPPKTHFLDFSSAALIDEATAKAVMDENIPARVWKLYPASKYGFVSQVEGGVTPAGICVVSARVTQITLTSNLRAPLFRPQKTAIAYDAVPGAGADQCKALARDKLKEATTAVVSALVKT